MNECLATTPREVLPHGRLRRALLCVAGREWCLPGTAELERCDGAADDCDGETDEGC